MSTEFDIKLRPESEHKLKSLARAGKVDLRPTLRVIGIGYRKEVDLIFSHQQARGEGLKWAPLSEQYRIRKEREYPGMPILVRTGALLASMTIEGAPGNISLISKASAVFGTSVFYGIYHDSDGARKSNLPRRNFSEPSDKRLAIWLEQIRRDIQHNFEREGITVKGDIFQ